MAKKIDRTREKIKSKADIKAENIQNAVAAYQAPDSELLMRQAAALFHCSKSLIANHINEEKKIPYLPNHAVDHQKLTPVEEAALKDHIDDCYKSRMPLSPRLLRDLANELCRAKGDTKDIGINWYLGFYERHTVVGMDAPSECATIMRKRDVRREPRTTKQTKCNSLSVTISKTRQTSSVINNAFSQNQVVSNQESHSQ